MPRADVAPQAPPQEAWDRYLTDLAQYGSKWKCLERVGLTRKDLNAKLQDVEFRDAVDHAMDLYADKLEEELVGARFPVGYIVRLKALRPNQYIERHATMALTINAEMTVSETDAAALLTKMLRDVQPHTMKKLMEGTG